MLVKRKKLAKLGYTTVSVPYWEWDALLSKVCCFPSPPPCVCIRASPEWGDAAARRTALLCRCRPRPERGTGVPGPDSLSRHSSTRCAVSVPRFDSPFACRLDPHPFCEHGAHSSWADRSRVNMAHVRQSGPDSGLGFQM